MFESIVKWLLDLEVEILKFKLNTFDPMIFYYEYCNNAIWSTITKDGILFDYQRYPNGYSKLYSVIFSS